MHIKLELTRKEFTELLILTHIGEMYAMVCSMIVMNMIHSSILH